MESVHSKDDVIRRSGIRSLGVFLDGPAMDRACKRLGKKIDLKALVKAVSGGLSPAVLRYYTLVPFEDDSRHRAFLNAVSNVGFETVVKRLPPKGVTKQVSVDIEITADIMAFGQGLTELPRLDAREGSLPSKALPIKRSDSASSNTTPSLVIICPNKELLYPLMFLKELGIDVKLADFMPAGNTEFIKVCKSWMDLSDTQNIWRS